MTCIVGIIKKGKVTIAGDSAGVSGLNVIVRKDKKVFKVQDFVIGCTSSFRMIQLIRFSFKPPKKHPDVDAFEFMCTTFIDALRQCFKNGGFAVKEKEAEMGGTFLVGFQGRLFKIYDDYQVSESVDDYNACGCGESFALGALDAIEKNISAEQTLTKALTIATYRSGGVRPPYIFESE